LAGSPWDLHLFVFVILTIYLIIDIITMHVPTNQRVAFPPLTIVCGCAGGMVVVGDSNSQDRRDWSTPETLDVSESSTCASGIGRDTPCNPMQMPQNVHL
jgi:hypothetical protein